MLPLLAVYAGLETPSLSPRWPVIEAPKRAAAAAAIAAEADTSIGNLYKYFADKDELFAAVVPAELVGQLRALLREQVEALGTERDVEQLPPELHDPFVAAVLERIPEPVTIPYVRLNIDATA